MSLAQETLHREEWILLNIRKFCMQMKLVERVKLKRGLAATAGQ